MKGILLIMLCIMPFNYALAAKTATDGRVDPRIKYISYNERDVIIVHGHYGYSTHIVFADDEIIQHLSPGDSLAWQIVPKQNHLFLKPMENDANTNLSVLTNKRMYQFELRAKEARNSADKSLTFTVKFNYPKDDMRADIERASRELERRDTEAIPDRRRRAEDMNLDYSMRGSDSTAPTRVFDDGEFTYFQFPENTESPAIFLVDADKKEAIVNFHVRGRYTVVQRIGAQFILRNGDQSTCVYNNTMKTVDVATVTKEPASTQTADEYEIDVND